MNDTAGASPAGPPGRQGGGLPFDWSDEVLARAAWSRLAEPADRAAGVLVRALGPVAALEWLLTEAVDAEGAVRTRVSPPAICSPEAPVPRSDPARAAAWTIAVGRWAPRLKGLDVRREIDVLERLGGSLLIPGDAQWPVGVDELDQPPFCLWLRGDPAVLAAMAAGPTAGPGEAPVLSNRAGPGAGLCLAVVGARASTRYGEQVARQMGRELTAHGVLVVSGGAFGIDAAAHRGALQAGPTLAVSAGGVDRLYPAGNSQLLEAIIDSGALIAEVPPGCQPGRHRFLSRNRLIAAMTSGTVVVEAAWRSGALSTARHARDLGRELGAVPGPVTSMASAGCHRLLREGAVCVTDADEALELVAPLGSTDPDAVKEADSSRAGRGLLDGLDEEQSRVLDAMPARAAAGLESVARSAGLGVGATRSALGLLELGGRVVCQGGRWRRLPQGTPQASARHRTRTDETGSMR